MKTNFAFDKIKDAAKTVFDRVAKAADQETDPDLMIFDGLKNEDFDEIIKAYGIEPTINYIQKMAFKKATKSRR